MTAAAGDLLPRLRSIDRMPFRDDVEVGPDVEKAIQEQGPRFAGKLLEREHANAIVIDAQESAMCLKLRAAHLPVESARAQQSNVLNLRGAEVCETPDEP